MTPVTPHQPDQIGCFAGWLRWLIRTCVTSLLIALPFVVATAAIYGPPALARAIVVAPNAGRTFLAKDDPAPAVYRALGADEQLRVEIADAASGSFSLAVWLFEPAGKPRGTVFVLHGIRSDKYWLRGLAAQIAREGYRVVLPDLPGHGLSSGDWLTYGVREAPAMKGLLDALAREGRVHGNVGVLGISYGGAVAIQFAALEPRVRAVVAIAPFSSLRAVVPDYVRNYLPGIGLLIPDSFVQSLVNRAGELARFNPDDASPLAAIARTHAQILLIHGRADAHIAPSQSVALHAAAPAHSALTLVEGDDHFFIATDRTRTIATRGMAWLHRWLDITDGP